MGEVAKTNRLDKIKRIVAGKDELLTALFRRTYQTLSPVAKRIFLTLSSWRTVIPQLALESVMWRPENERMDVENAIEELRKSSLIEVSTSEEDDSVFLGVPLAASIFGHSEYDISPEKISINIDKELLMEFGAGKQSDIKNGFGPRIERKFKSFSRKVASGTSVKLIMY
ncbi:MAG: hypothetical protein KAS71_14205 [Bacteroidales bacterium]|nr:hypothetical protein [Bacteroidales bacterium]